MQSVLLILPDFLIILLGAFISHVLKYPREFWKYTEKLVFYVLFPPLLFLSVSSAHLSLSEASQFLLVGIGAMLLAVVSSWLIRYVAPEDGVTNASVFQCGFRFNTYIGFALCLKLYGDSGFSLLALLIAVWVPISNTIAVAVLATAVSKSVNKEKKIQPSYIIKTVLKNPLIIATVLGLVFNVAQWELPQVGTSLFRSLGNASLAVGLLCIGSSLQLHDLKRYSRLLLTCTVQRLVVVPIIALGVGVLMGLPVLETMVLVLFGALPTAQSCYVMTSSMGGNATAVADVTTVHTLASMVTLPVWVAIYLMP